MPVWLGLCLALGSAAPLPKSFHEAVVYEVYWRTFAHDAHGMLEHLDYLRDLGVDIVWITPMYPSGGADGGYDIRDLRGVDAAFGSRADFDALVAACRARGMRLMLDMVFNHVSEQHPWFVAASSPQHPQYKQYHDYFYWRDGPVEQAPDPNASIFGGSRWRYVPAVHQWVLHTFTPEQLDLNWHNPAVRSDIAAVLKYWVQQRVGGFRFDAITLIDKDPEQPHLLGWLQGMRQAAYGDEENIVTVGEMSGVSLAQAKAITHPAARALNMVFNFDIVDLTNPPGIIGKFVGKPWTPEGLKQVFIPWQEGLQDVGWNSLWLGDHDWARVLSRLGDPGTYRVASAKMLATLQFAHQGTPFVYQGDELGLPNTTYDSIDGYHDVETLNYYRQSIGAGMDKKQVMQQVQAHSRDAVRGPMPWDEAHAQMRDKQSVWAHYHHWIDLRHHEPALVQGRYQVLPSDAAVYAFTRVWQSTTLLVVINLVAKPQRFAVPTALRRQAEVLSTNVNAPPPLTAEMPLQPYQAVVYRLH